MTSYKLSESAKEDLIRIHNYGTINFGQIEADNYYNTFFEHFQQIAQRPMSFESVDHIRNGYRRCVCGVDSIYFRINNGSIEIMSIIGKQDLERIK
jgi:toxin ParE1/3/4